MNIKLFFSPVGGHLFENIDAPNSFVQNIQLHHEEMPDIEQADIALIGLTENRGGSLENHDTNLAADNIRRALYPLKRGSGDYRIIDLGNLQNGINLEDTYKRVKEVSEMLISINVLPILIGGSHDLDYGQFTAYEGLEKLVSLLVLDAFVDLGYGENRDDIEVENNHLHRILLHEPNFLLNYAHLGYQSYLNDHQVPVLLDRFNFDSYRLGQVNQNITAMEPVIRAADLLSFDITAIKFADAPGSPYAQPFGLTGQEACQLCWYAGLNEQLSSAGFYGYNPSLDDSRKTTASVVATMIWYIIEGYYHRENAPAFNTKNFQKFVVPMEDQHNVLVFYKSLMSEKWWMEVPLPKNRDSFTRNNLVPCDYSDYEVATKGELPEKWVQAVSKWG